MAITSLNSSRLLGLGYWLSRKNNANVAIRQPPTGKPAGGNVADHLNNFIPALRCPGNHLPCLFVITYCHQEPLFDHAVLDSEMFAQQSDHAAIGCLLHSRTMARSKRSVNFAF